MPRPQSGATKDRLVRVQARSVTGPRHRPPRAGAGWPCSPSPDRQGRDRPEVAPRPRQIDPSEQMLRLASAPRIRPPRAGSRTILAPMGAAPVVNGAAVPGAAIGADGRAEDGAAVTPAAGVTAPAVTGVVPASTAGQESQRIVVLEAQVRHLRELAENFRSE